MSRRKCSAIGCQVRVMLMTLLLGTFAHSSFLVGQDSQPFREGELIVQFHDDVDSQEIDSIRQSFDLDLIKRSARRNRVLLKVEPETSLDEVAEKLRDHPSVEYVEKNYIIYTSASPNDTNYQNDDQWYHDAMDSEAAWDYSTGDSGTVVAIIDNGVDYDHEDLDGQIWANPGEIPSNATDDDSNNYIDDIVGWDFVDDDNDPSGDCSSGHATAIAGIIGAETNNSQGIAGLNWDVKLMILKAFNPFSFGIPCSGKAMDIADAIKFAVDNGADIINFSFEYETVITSIKNEIDAAESAGAIIVTAAGNDGSDLDSTGLSYPCGHTNSNIICVGAVDDSGDKATFSNYGTTSVDLGAPGVDIFSTLPSTYSQTNPPCPQTTGDYGEPCPMNLGDESGNGTSFATPMVAGVAALMKDYSPSYTHEQLIDSLVASAQPTSTGDLVGRFRSDGMLNARAAVTSFGDTFDDATPSNYFFSDIETTGERWAVAQNGSAQCDPVLATVGGDRSIEMKYAKAPGQGGAYWTLGAWEGTYPPSNSVQTMVFRLTTSDGSSFADDKGRAAVGFIEEDSTSTEECSATSEDYTEMTFGGSSMAGIELDGSGTATAFLFFSYPDGMGGYSFSENYYDDTGEPFSVSSYSKLSISIYYGPSTMTLRITDTEDGSIVFEKTSISYPTQWWPSASDFKPAFMYYGVDTGDSSAYTIDGRVFLSVR